MCLREGGWRRGTTRGSDFGRDRDFGGRGDRDFGGRDRDRDFGGRDRDFGGRDRDRDFGGRRDMGRDDRDRDRGFGGGRRMDVDDRRGPTRADEGGSWRSAAPPPVRER